jgi:hypothetical protein
MSALDRFQRGALALGTGSVLALAGGGVANPTQFFRSWLFALLFWLGLSVGCLSLAMIHHLTGGTWGLVIRRILEAGGRTVFACGLLFLPLAFGLKDLYAWARPQDVAADPFLQHKSLYLNPGFFIVRALIYFLVWAALAHFLSVWSRDLDRGEDPGISRRLRMLSAGGLVLLGLTITFASIDWAMSLDAHWFSSIYGMVFMVGQALSALCFAVVVLALLGRTEPLSQALRPTDVHDLGKLMLAFLMLWAYVSFSQFLIIWSGNLPDEISWYRVRLGEGWGGVGLFLVLFHLAVPFLLLLSRELKRNLRRLGFLAAGLLGARVVDLFWLVGPELHLQGLTVHWMDVAASAAVGGLWLAVFAWQLKGQPLLPQADPDLRPRLQTAAG